MSCFCGMVDERKGPVPGILIIANLRHAASRIWTWAELEFRLCRMKLCSYVNHFNSESQFIFLFHAKIMFLLSICWIFYMFNYFQNFYSCDVLMRISTLCRNYFSIYLLSRTSFGRETWLTNKCSHSNIS